MSRYQCGPSTLLFSGRQPISPGEVFEHAFGTPEEEAMALESGAVRREASAVPSSPESPGAIEIPLTPVSFGIEPPPSEPVSVPVDDEQSGEPSARPSRRRTAEKE